MIEYRLVEFSEGVSSGLFGVESTVEVESKVALLDSAI